MRKWLVMTMTAICQGSTWKIGAMTPRPEGADAELTAQVLRLASATSYCASLCFSGQGYTAESSYVTVGIDEATHVFLVRLLSEVNFHKGCLTWFRPELVWAGEGTHE